MELKPQEDTIYWILIRIMDMNSSSTVLLNKELS